MRIFVLRQMLQNAHCTSMECLQSHKNSDILVKRKTYISGLETLEFRFSIKMLQDQKMMLLYQK